MRDVLRYGALMALLWLVLVLSVDASALEGAIAAVLPRVDAACARTLYESAAAVSDALYRAWVAVETATGTGGVGANDWVALRESILPSVWIIERIEAIGNALWLVGLRVAALGPSFTLIGALIVAGVLDARVTARRRRQALRPATPALALAAARATALAFLGTALVLTVPLKNVDTVATLLFTAIAPLSYLSVSRRPVVAD